MNHRPRWINSNPLKIDDMTGFITRTNDSRMQWNQLIVRAKDYEVEQPQNYLRAIPDDMSVPDPRPEASDTFINSDAITQQDGNLILLEGSSTDYLVQESN